MSEAVCAGINASHGYRRPTTASLPHPNNTVIMMPTMMVTMIAMMMMMMVVVGIKTSRKNPTGDLVFCLGYHNHDDH